MAKCPKCGNSSLFSKLPDGMCDRCTISELRHDLLVLQNRYNALDVLAQARSSDLEKALNEIKRLSVENKELALRCSQLASARQVSIPANSSAHYLPDDYVFKRDIMTSLSDALSTVERASTLQLKIERLQQYIDLFDKCSEACNSRGVELAEWFHNMYVVKHDHRRYACEKLDECTILINSPSAGADSALDNLGNVRINIIREEDGILQREVGKRFDVQARSHVRNLLYKMEQSGAITRTKSGSSYELRLVNDGAAFTLLVRTPSGSLLDEVKYCRFCSVLRPVYENNVCSVCRHSVW